MNRRNQVFECEVCGEVAEVLRDGAGELFCCGVQMQSRAENSTDAADEKHVPVAIKISGGVKIEIGEIAHPMENSHFIEWVEVANPDGEIVKKFLKPGETPAAEFQIKNPTSARAFCNLHGLWKTEI